MVGIIELTGTTPKAEPIVTPPIPSAVGAGTLLANPQLFMFIVVLEIAGLWELVGTEETARAPGRGRGLEERHLEDHLVHEAGLARTCPAQEALRLMLPAAVSSPWLVC